MSVKQSESGSIRVISDERESARQYVSPVKLVRHLWAQRELIKQLAQRSVLQGYQGSYLGAIWSFITPLGMLLVYTFVFSVVFKARGQGDLPGGQAGFALSLFTGLTVFEILGNSIITAPRLISQNRNYVTKVVFPLEILPVSQLGASLIDSVFKFILVAIGAIVILGGLPWTVIFLPLMYVPLIFLSLGLSWFLASLGVFLQDINHLLGVMVRMLLFMTPIFYPIEAVPVRWRFIMYINPLAFIVNHFRRVMLWGQTPDWGEYLILSLITFGICMAGYIWFMKSKRLFSDVI